jgi:hypothetical protein
MSGRKSSAHLVAKPFDFVQIGGAAEAAREVEALSLRFSACIPLSMKLTLAIMHRIGAPPAAPQS